MNGANASVLQSPVAPPASLAARLRPFRPFMLAVAALVVVFSWPLWQLAVFSQSNQLNSHVLLIPFAALYLAWTRIDHLPAAGAPNRGLALFFGSVALVLIGFRFAMGQLHTEDALALSIASFCFAIFAAAAWCLGSQLFRTLLYPLGTLLFMIPLPTALTTSIETALQHGSATVAHWFFLLSGMPVFREHTLFMLPGFSMEVAPECSGIRSSYALLITSVFAGYLFLNRWSTRLILTLAVIPLALVRNGLRVWVIGELCVKISPDMIHSWVHKQGGPFFFALSLIPFSILLFLLVRSERRARRVATS